MGSPRTWNDQPVDVEEADVIAHINLGDKTGEVRVRHDDADTIYYLTVGTIFGSQTIRCTDADVVFQALDGRHPKKKIPDGAELYVKDGWA